MRRMLAGLLVGSLTVSPQLWAYEQPVHIRMTETAYTRLALDFMRRLGIDREAEVAGDPAIDWMAKGAHDEDDLFPSLLPLNHFFDPVHDRALSIRFVGCLQVGVAADDWSFGSVAAPWGIVASRRYYRAALLGTTPFSRDAALRNLLLSLGHSVHLVQDMAQPEHTRNDQHLPFSQALFGSKAASLYEQWTGARAEVLTYVGYPTVKLPSYASYFHTSEVDELNRPAGRGMADFANRNFVTQDTNYSDAVNSSCDYLPPKNCFQYDLPRIDEAIGRTHTETEIVLEPPGVPVQRTFEERSFLSFPRDYYHPGIYRDENHTHYSLLDRETAIFGCNTYSLAEDSFQSRADLLLPRAVGYSAGLIEHFFRGDIDVDWHSTSPGSYNMTITNRSAEVIGAGAHVEAVYRASPEYFGVGSSDDVAPIFKGDIKLWVPDFVGLIPGASVTIPDVKPWGLHEGDHITKFERRVVLTGTLGTTPLEVIGLVQPPAGPGVVKVEVKWTPITANLTLRIINGLADGRGSAGYAGFGKDEQAWESNVNRAGGKVDIVNPTGPGGPMSITLLEAKAGQHYFWHLGGHVPGSAIKPTAEVTITVNGKAVTKTVTVESHPDLTPLLWRYP